MWSKENTRKTLRDRLGLEEGKVVRSLDEDEDYHDMGVWPTSNGRPKLTRQNKRDIDRLLREGKPKREKKEKKR